MAEKSISEEKFEEMIAGFLRASVDIFAEEKEEECLMAHKRRGIEIEDEINDEILDEMNKEVDGKLLDSITNDLRSLFNELLGRDNQPLSAIGYLIERYEGTIRKLKSGGKIRKFTLADLITNPEVHLDDYLELLEKAIQRLKFEFEVI